MNGHGGPLVFVSTRNLRCVYHWVGFKNKEHTVSGSRCKSNQKKKSTHQQILILASTEKKLLLLLILETSMWWKLQ